MPAGYRAPPKPAKGSSMAFDSRSATVLHNTMRGGGSAELRDFVSRKFSPQDQVALFHLAQDAVNAAAKQRKLDILNGVTPAADVKPRGGEGSELARRVICTPVNAVGADHENAPLRRLFRALKTNADATYNEPLPVPGSFRQD